MPAIRIPPPTVFHLPGNIIVPQVKHCPISKRNVDMLSVKHQTNVYVLSIFSCDWSGAEEKRF